MQGGRRLKVQHPVLPLVSAKRPLHGIRQVASSSPAQPTQTVAWYSARLPLATSVAFCTNNRESCLIHSGRMPLVVPTEQPYSAQCRVTPARHCKWENRCCFSPLFNTAALSCLHVLPALSCLHVCQHRSCALPAALLQSGRSIPFACPAQLVTNGLKSFHEC